MSLDRVAAFRAQIEIADGSGTEDVAALDDIAAPTFGQIATGGRREPRATTRPRTRCAATPARGIMLGLLRQQLVSQLTHAGYLGRELATAETAVRPGLAYEQDRPLAR